MLRVMAKPAQRSPIADTAYLVVFGAFIGYSLYQLISGTSTKFTWVALLIAGFLFAGTAWRMFKAYSGPPAA
jgi:hypothetical protein